MKYHNDNRTNEWAKWHGRNLPVLTRVLINIVLVIGVLVILSLIVIAVSKSGYFDTRGYTVRGNSFLTGEEVFGLSELKMGTNLYSLKLGNVENRLEDDPRISGAVVRRRFPDTVIIEVEETRPVAVINVAGRLYKIAEDGTIIAPLNGQYEDLPYLYGFEMETKVDIPVGKKIPGSDVESGLNVASTLADCPALGVEVSAIHVDKNVMYLGEDGVAVRYDENLTEKQVSRLARIWGILPKGESIYEIDLRYGSDIIVKGL